MMIRMKYMKNKANLTPHKVNQVIFLLVLAGVAFYLASTRILAGWELYYRTWIMVIGDIMAFFILPVSFLALFLTGNLKELSKENGIGGKITYVFIVLLVSAALFLYLMIGGLFLWGRHSWEKESRLSADMLEGIRTADIADHTVSNYYVCNSFFLKKKIPYTEEIEQLKAEKIFEETGRWPETELPSEEKTGDSFVQMLQDEKKQQEDTDTVQSIQKDEASGLAVEEAYDCLYREVFASLGDAYDCRYNAKGNFYAQLSEEKGRLNEETPEMDIVRTVVYDRISKNGKCHLFVYYETYYDQDGLEYTTAIRNTYAVDMTTGKVTESGKHAWEDTGCEAYQEAAGEP